MKFLITLAALCSVIVLASAAPRPNPTLIYPGYGYGGYSPYGIYGGGGANAGAYISGNDGIVPGVLGALLGSGYNQGFGYPIYGNPFIF